MKPPLQQTHWLEKLKIVPTNNTQDGALALSYLLSVGPSYDPPAQAGLNCTLHSGGLHVAGTGRIMHGPEPCSAAHL